MQLMQGDCLELMTTIPDTSIDMILCDLPYGTTACVNTNREFIGIEKDPHYFALTSERIENRITERWLGI